MYLKEICKHKSPAQPRNLFCCKRPYHLPLSPEISSGVNGPTSKYESCPSHTTASLTLTPHFQCWRCTSKILFHRRNTCTWSMENQAESSLLGFYLHHFLLLDNSCHQCSSVQDSICMQGKAHMCSTLSHISFPSVDHPSSQKFPQCWPPCLLEVSPVLTTLSQMFPQCWPPCLSEVSPVLTTLSLRSFPSVDHPVS